MKSMIMCGTGDQRGGALHIQTRRRPLKRERRQCVGADRPVQYCYDSGRGSHD